MATISKKRKAPQNFDDNAPSLPKPNKLAEEEKLEHFIEGFVDFLVRKIKKSTTIEGPFLTFDEYGKESNIKCSTEKLDLLFYERVVPIILKKDLNWETKARIFFLTSTCIFCSSARQKLENVGEVEFDEELRIKKFTSFIGNVFVAGNHHMAKNISPPNKEFFEKLQADAMTDPCDLSDETFVESQRNCERSVEVFKRTSKFFELFAFRLSSTFKTAFEKLHHLAGKALDAQNSNSMQKLSYIKVQESMLVFFKRLTTSTVTRWTQYPLSSVIEILKKCLNELKLDEDTRCFLEERICSMNDMNKTISSKTLYDNFELFFDDLWNASETNNLTDSVSKKPTSQDSDDDTVKPFELLKDTEHTRTFFNHYYREFFVFMNRFLLRVVPFFPDVRNELNELTIRADQSLNTESFRKELTLGILNYHFIRFVKKLANSPRYSNYKQRSVNNILEIIRMLFDDTDEFSDLELIAQVFQSLNERLMKLEKCVSGYCFVKFLHELFNDVEASAKWDNGRRLYMTTDHAFLQKKTETENGEGNRYKNMEKSKKLRLVRKNTIQSPENHLTIFTILGRFVQSLIFDKFCKSIKRELCALNKRANRNTEFANRLKTLSMSAINDCIVTYMESIMSFSKKPQAFFIHLSDRFLYRELRAQTVTTPIAIVFEEAFDRFESLKRSDFDDPSPQLNVDALTKLFDDLDKDTQ